jgi:hypothetical protein
MEKQTRQLDKDNCCDNIMQGIVPVSLEGYLEKPA